MKCVSAVAAVAFVLFFSPLSLAAEYEDALTDIEDLKAQDVSDDDDFEAQKMEELQRNRQQTLDKNRARLRQELQHSAALDKQADARNNLDKVDPALAEFRRQNAKRTYQERGRNELLTSGDATVDAKIISEWAREQRLRNDEESNRRMQEELRKRYPATSAAQAINGWSEGEDITDKRAEARKILRERSEQMRKNEE